jgi:hypothetical protein
MKCFDNGTSVGMRLPFHTLVFCRRSPVESMFAPDLLLHISELPISELGHTLSLSQAVRIMRHSLQTCGDPNATNIPLTFYSNLID